MQYRLFQTNINKQENNSIKVKINQLLNKFNFSCKAALQKIVLSLFSSV